MIERTFFIIFQIFDIVCETHDGFDHEVNTWLDSLADVSAEKFRWFHMPVRGLENNGSIVCMELTPLGRRCVLEDFRLRKFEGSGSFCRFRKVS